MCNALLSDFLPLFYRFFDVSLQCKFHIVCHRTAAGLCLLLTVDKIGDVKAGISAKAALIAMSEACTMPWVAEQVSKALKVVGLVSRRFIIASKTSDLTAQMTEC